MKFIRIALIFPLVIIILGSCSKNNKEKDNVFYGYEHESESTTEESSYIVDGQDVSYGSFEMHIPEEYSLTDNGNSLRIENENNTFDISIEEHEYTDDSFENYLSETLEGYRQIGAEVSEPEAVTIGNYDMQRVKLSYVPMQAYGYFVDQGDKASLVLIVSNEKEMLQNESDAILEKLNISF